VWKRLDHPNIVPFKGVTFEPPQLVSEWMDGGELRKYIGDNPHANLVSLVSPPLHPSRDHLIPSLVTRGCRRSRLSSLM